MEGYVKEYLDLGATPERLAELEEEFRKPVREWEKKFILGMPYGKREARNYPDVLLCTQRSPYNDP